jgi:hypothetical protein
VLSVSVWKFCKCSVNSYKTKTLPRIKTFIPTVILQRLFHVHSKGSDRSYCQAVVSVASHGYTIQSSHVSAQSYWPLPFTLVARGHAQTFDTLHDLELSVVTSNDAKYTYFYSVCSCWCLSHFRFFYWRIVLRYPTQAPMNDLWLMTMLPCFIHLSLMPMLHQSLLVWVSHENWFSVPEGALSDFANFASCLVGRSYPQSYHVRCAKLANPRNNGQTHLS